LSSAAARLRWRIPELHFFQRVSSSNDVALRRAAEGAPAGTTVIADAQTAGRGQRGRGWSAVSGKSILMSVVLRGEGDAVDTSVMPVRVGLAAARALELAADVIALIKWPNDLVLPDGRKLGGILCQGTSGPDGNSIVAGIGINVLQSDHDFAGDLRTTAASVHTAGGRADRALLVAAILDALRPFRIAGPPLDAVTLQAILARDALRGHEITLDDRPAGRAHGIAPDGTLIVGDAANLRRVHSGTVRLALNPKQIQTATPTPFGRPENAP
jgi:BirA family biotin operon repressor/biotin-[acetyl-CoA-carboxylase] ligase